MLLDVPLSTFDLVGSAPRDLSLLCTDADTEGVGCRRSERCNGDLINPSLRANEITSVNVRIAVKTSDPPPPTPHVTIACTSHR